MAKAGLLYVGTNDGLVLFSDPGAGGRWLRVGHELRGGTVTAVWIQADNPLVALAATSTGVQRSEDGGRSWAIALSGAAANNGGTLATLPGKEPVLLVASGAGIARSEDSGATWATSDVDQPWSGAVSLVAPSGYHIDTAFAGTVGGQIAISTDRGHTWRVLRDGLPPVRCVAAGRLD